MSFSIQMLKIELVDQLELMAASRVKPSEAAYAGSFLRALYENAAPGDFVAERPEHLLEAGLSLLKFCRQRDIGKPEVRVFQPRVDTQGYNSDDTVVEIVNDDMPFLVDSVHAAFDRLPGTVRLLIHPIVDAERTATGSLMNYKFPPRNPGAQLESVMHLRIVGLRADQFEHVQTVIRSVLSDVRAATEDFNAMISHCRAQSKALGRRVQSDGPIAGEGSRFLAWMSDQHFTFLGYSYCRFESAPLSSAPLDLSDMGARRPMTPGVRFDRDRGLGILRDPSRSMFDVFEPPRKREPLRILKANRYSTVHRGVHLDTIIVSDFDLAGQLIGAHMFVGLFSASAYNLPTSEIPLISEKIRRALEHSGFSPESHNGRRLRFLLETYPRDELLQISDVDLFSIGLGILHLQYRSRVALFVRRDPFGRFVSCLVYVPRDRLDTNLRLRVGEILCRAFDGSLNAYYPHVGDASLARLHLLITTPGMDRRQLDFAALERKLELAARSWKDRLALTLPAELGIERGGALAEKYGTVFPAAYREDFDEIDAIDDIEHIEDACCRNELGLHLYRGKHDAPHAFHLKLFSPTGFVELSRVMPILENLGLNVIGEVPYEIHLHRGQAFWMHDFGLAMSNGRRVETDAVKQAFGEVFSLTWNGRTDDDGFNQLVLHANLSARQVALLRAFAKYLRQICVPFSEGYMQQTLRNNGHIAQLLVQIFEARFHPEQQNQTRAQVLASKLHFALDQVKSLDEDRILRQFSNVIEATTRTNFYQMVPAPTVTGTAQPKDHLAFKIESRRITGLPPPAPYREIFVSGPRTEGVHLRFGEVARGGLRWSDRQEDFRTEVLGLVKAQQVKNAVIVPVGSKGGFVLKQPPAADAGRDALREEGIACYKIFIDCLLDLTDNQCSNPPTPNPNGTRNSIPPPSTIVAPQNTVCLDAADPYLVVAADKGTATFSDIANGLSQTRHFWLDDAFASGGSAGYDHKKMGITAKGAWESVKRHFREMGKNIQEQPFTVAGVGDMSGDVFGNGMLLSRQILLVAAFDHRDVFLDPDPDPARSFAERERIFALDRSSWNDYSPELISEGGGVFSRQTKSIPLSPQVRKLLGVDATALAPSELVSAILKAQVELLFFGGIGTYCKARAESHAQVGDRANDALRIDAAHLGAAVVGEGANLGLTQRARVEFCLAGGRCNSDFIDNSAGVDCSDHEVNIKILLGEVERRGDLTRDSRNQLLGSMTEELSTLVLRDNYEQTQSLGVTGRLGNHLTDRLARTLRSLEKSGHLDRALEFLPDDEVLAERQRLGDGFTRPEICVLMAYAKNSLAEALLKEGLPSSNLLNRDLQDYFPKALQRDYARDIARHRLHKELRVTLVTNDLVNRAGIAFAQEVSESTGASGGAIALAYVAAREILDMRSVWSEIEQLDNQVAAAVQCDLLIECARLIERVTVWLLREHPEGDLEQHVERYRNGVKALSQQLGALLATDLSTALQERTQAYEEGGVPHALAQSIASLRDLLPAVDIVRVAELSQVEIALAGKLYFAVGTRFGFEWLRSAARTLPSLRSWDRQAVAGVKNDLFASQRAFALAVLNSADGAQPYPILEQWAEKRSSDLERWDLLLAEMHCAPKMDFGMLTVALRQLTHLAAQA